MHKVLIWGMALATAAVLGGCTASRTVIVHDSRPVTVAKAPGHFEASRVHTRNGRRFFERGHYRKAIQQFELAIAEDPANWEAHFYLAESYRELRDFDRCLVHYQRVRDLHPGEPLWMARAEYGIGVVFERRGDIRSAREHFDLALGSVPDFDPARRAKARLISRKLKERYEDEADHGHGKRHND